MKKKSRESEGEGSWLNTYADMVTLLLTFFVVLFSMSAVEQEKFDELIRSFTNPNGTSSSLWVGQSGASENSGLSPESTDGSGSSPATQTGLPANMDELYEYLKQYVEGSNNESSIDVTKKDGIVYIRFSNDMLFEPDKADLTKESMKTLSFLGKGLKNMESRLKMIQISGHTAQATVSNTKVNDWVLSSTRAANVATYFEENENVSAVQMVVQGCGDQYPIASNDTVEGRQKNRRVEISIIGEEAKISGGVDDSLNGYYDSSKFPAGTGDGGPFIPPGPSSAAPDSASGSGDASKNSPYSD